MNHQDNRNYGTTAIEPSLSSTLPDDSLLVWLPSNGSTDQSTWDSMKDRFNHYFHPIVEPSSPPPSTPPMEDDTIKKSTSQSEMVPLQPYDTGSYQNGTDTSKKQDNRKLSTTTNRSTRGWMNLVGVGSILSVLIISISWWYYTVIVPPHEVGVRSSSSTSSSDDNDIVKVNESNDMDKDTSIDQKPSQILNPNHQQTKKLPFSILDPVHDLGLYHFSRPDDSSPRSAMMLGRYKQEMKQKQKQQQMQQDSKEDDENNNDTTTTYQHYVFPTNAWYQNLLMYENKTSTDHKPGSEYRAYTIPYIVDVTGPIPGLRVHANQIGASSNVIQLNIIAEYGLTLGASINPIVDYHKNKDNDNDKNNVDIGSSNSSDSDDTMTQSASVNATSTPTNPIDTSIPNHEFQYSIYQATPLSVTLEWVSSCLQQLSNQEKSCPILKSFFFNVFRQRFWPVHESYEKQ
jgi:hypothetical protein